MPTFRNREHLRDWLVQSANAGLAAAAAVAADVAARSLGTDHGGVSSAPGSPPNSQTGNLRNRIAFATPEECGTPLKAIYGATIPYAKYLEYGAVITPKNVKALPVPINAQARRMLQRLSGYGSATVTGSLRVFDLKYIPGKGGKDARLVEKTPGGKEKKNGAVFVLKKRVVIKARPFLRPAGEKGKAQMVAAFRDVIRQRLSTAP